MPTQLEATSTLAYSQKGRAIGVETALGPDALLLTGFDGEEEIAGGFRYTLDLLSKDPAIAAAKLIYTPASIRVTASDGSTRYINGMISSFVQKEVSQGLTVYQAELRPWFWFLSLGANFRTFQGMTLPDIVKKVCKDASFSDVVVKCIKKHPVHEYRVQYGETDLDFIQRLMEEEGIFWFAEFDGKKCNLLLADDNSVAKHVVKLRMSSASQDAEDEFTLQSFTLRQEVCSGKYSSLDYNFETPSTQLLGNVQKTGQEVMEYPGGQATRDDAVRLARTRQGELVAEEIEASGSGKCRLLRVGVKVEIADHLSRGLAGSYLVTGVKQSAKLGEYRSGGGEDVAYSTSFTATPFATPYVPERTTEVPRAYGYDSAVVVGPAGEEIYTDKYGRVKVQFFWDREGKKDDKSSCWVRVSTVWAGKGWGVISTPRIGQEVLVAYLNGDPDEPIIVGRVYNAEQMPPYALPANKTQSGIKTRSTVGGSPDNFNEIRFEDKKGSEELYIHAEKDKKETVEHNNAESIGNDESIDVGNDQSLNVGGNQTVTVGKEQRITVDGDRSVNVGKSESISVGKDRRESVAESEAVNIGKDRSHNVGKNDSLNVAENRTQSIGKNEQLTVTEKRTTDIGKEDILTVGKKLVITAADEITLKAGDASISMKKNGDITIKGNNITVDGSGKINVKASSDLVMKGSKVTAN